MKTQRAFAFALLTTTALCSSFLSANAAVVSLTFEGIVPHDGTNALIKDYYNGGMSSYGTTGTNYGISFSDNASTLCLNTSSTSCSNTSRGGVGDPNSANTGLVFFSGDQTYLNYAAGFDTGFSFNYAAPNHTGSVEVYSGLNGTGDLLATISLAFTPSTFATDCYGAEYCPFVPVGVTFSGQAKSISFAGTANYIVFDDVTFGSSTPGMSPVPLPASLPMFGAALLACAAAARFSRYRTTRVG